MKKFFLVSLALASSMTFAADVDYSRCLMSLGGLNIDHEGKVQSQWSTIKSQRTEGNKEYLVLESAGFLGSNKKMETKVTLERDSQGRVVRFVSGGDAPTAEMKNQYRNMMVNSAVIMAPMSVGGGGFSNNGDRFMSMEPTFYVKKTGTATPGQNKGMIDPNYELVTLSRLTQDQAKEAGIENAEELKRLRQQWRRDRRTSERLRDSFKKVVDRSAMAIPLGMESEFEIQDGVCLPKSVNQRVYNSLSGQVNSYPISSKENCDKIRSVYQKHQRKITECNQANQNISQDYFKEMYGEGGLVGGIAGGIMSAPTGGTVHGSMLAGGMVGGMYPAGGIGIAGGMGGGMMGGMYGMYPGSMGTASYVEMQNQMCEWTYNADEMLRRVQGSTAGAQSGSTGSSSTQQ